LSKKMAKRKKDEEYRTFQAGSARHFDTRHTTFASKCPAGDSRKKACQELLWYGMVWYWNSASFAGALAIVRNGKPFTDGEYAKTLITVHDRTIMMSNQIEATQVKDINAAPFFSLFSVIARYVVSDTLREESLAVLPMKGEDLFKSFTEFEALCAQMCGEQLGEVMSLIIWVVNFIFARALNDHQFRTLLDKVGNNYPGLLLHSNVCWSSRGKVLSCFAACLSEIRTFLEMKNVEHPELANNEWLLKFYYLVDMTEHLNQLNVKMQGVGNTVLSLQQALFAFENKLELFVVHITYHTLQRVSIAVLTMFGSTYACEQSFSHLQNIKTNLRSRLTNGSLNACMKLNLTTYQPDYKAISKPIVSLDGPDGWARGWIGKGQRAPVRLRRQQGGGGVLVWAGIIKDELVGPFQVEDGVKLNSQSYCQFLEDTFFKQWYRKKSASFKKNMIFMQDNAPSHTSKYSTAWLERKGIKEEKLMTWPPCSPNLNPFENLWSIIKCEIYKEGKQYTSLNSVWEAMVAAARNVDGEQIKTLTESMDGRLLSVLAKKGGYIGR
uniref:Tc1-like transposase DDE domain-containing protein n=1 Tax=Pundamilia nyererei TaxID=303518 RepID=A0A3B4FRD4_9CICH